MARQVRQRNIGPWGSLTPLLMESARQLRRLSEALLPQSPSGRWARAGSITSSARGRSMSLSAVRKRSLGYSSQGHHRPPSLELVGQRRSQSSEPPQLQKRSFSLEWRKISPRADFGSEPAAPESPDSPMIALAELGTLQVFVFGRSLRGMSKHRSLSLEGV